MPRATSAQRAVVRRCELLVTVPADGAGRQAAPPITFASSGAAPGTKTILVPWTLVNLTVQIKRASNGLSLYNTNVQVTGGPANFTKVLTTPGFGTSSVTFVVPIGTTAYSITIPAYASTPAVAQNVPGPGNVTVTPVISVIGA